MSVRLSIQVKAAFLLLVFSLNTIVGFACAAGLDMGFNSKHHHHHDDDEVSPTKVTHHHEGVKHHHDEELNNKNNKSTDDDNCCNKGVIKFSELDKLLTHVVNAGIEIPVIFVFLHSFYLPYLAPLAKTTKQIQVARRCYFNSPDIRVSIQSFQI